MKTVFITGATKNTGLAIARRFAEAGYEAGYNIAISSRSAALGVEMSRVRVIGGGAKGTLWRQIIADVLNLKLEKVQVDDSSFGSAMVAAVGVGWYDSFTQAAEACVKIDCVCTPIPENRQVYDQLFQRYKTVHDVLAPIYDS